MQITTPPKTLWQSIWPWATQPKSTVDFYDPLKIKVGTVITLKTLELEGEEFTLEAISEYQRTIGSRVFTFTDYNLVAKPIGGKPIKVRLRANPIVGAKREDGISFNILMLELEDEMAFNKDFEGVMNDAETNMKWVVSLDGEEDGLQAGEHQDIEYARLGGVPKRFTANVCTVADANDDGKLDIHDIQSSGVEYLDFGREVQLEGGFTQTEFFFVEKSTENGWFTLLRGSELDRSKVVVF